MDRRRPFWAVLSIAALMLSAFPTFAQGSGDDSGPLRRIGGWSFGEALGVAYDAPRDLLYLGSGGAVLVLDIADVAHPEQVSDDILTEGLVTGLRYDATTERLYVAAGLAGLQIWDVQTPDSPQRLSALEVPSSANPSPVRNVDLYGDFALLECESSGAASVDVSDPLDPILIATNGSMGTPANDIHVSSDGYLHSVGSEYYVRIPIEPDGNIPGVGGLHLGPTRVVFGTEDAAFIEDYGDLIILDLQTPGTPHMSTTDVGYFYDMAVAGNLAYLGGGSDFNIYDVSDLSSPTLVGTLGVGADKLEVAGSYAYLADRATGFHAVDITDPATPLEVGAYDTPGWSRTTCLEGDRAYVAQGDDGVFILDLTDPGNPAQVGFYDSPGTAYDVKVVGDLAFVADYDGGLRVVDVSDPAVPGELGVGAMDNAYVLAVMGDYAYVVDNVLNEPDWLRVFDVSDPANPTELGSLLMEDDVLELDISGDYLFAAVDDSGMRVVGVSDPAAPVEVGAFQALNTFDVSVRGDYAYLASADWNGGFMTLDVSDPTQPVLLGSFNDQGWFHPFDMAVVGDFAYVSDPTFTSSPLMMLYIADPTAPVQVGSYAPPGDLLDITARDSLVYVSDGASGLLVLANDIFSVPGGGVGWREQESGTSHNLRSVHFVDPVSGWIAGDYGTILRTTDGGVEWMPKDGGTGEDLFTVFFADDQTGWVGGREGVILKTTDGGESWTPQTSGTGQQIRSIQFLDAALGWAVGGGGTILKTTDGGTTWLPKVSGATGYLMSVCFVDSTHGWIAGGSGEDALTLKTTDGGENWRAVYPPTSLVSLNSVHFVNEDVGWLVGYDAAIFKSIDGGDTWVEQYNDAGTMYASFSSVYAINEHTAWAVGYTGVYGRSMKTMNRGDNWTELLGGNGEALSSVFFVDQNNGWAVGHYGTILAATTNEGTKNFVTDVASGPSTPQARSGHVGLAQNYPNPFNPSTTIRYDLPEPCRVSVKIYDVAGRLVSVLKDQVAEGAGRHEVAWEGRDRSGRTVAAGVYFYRLEAGTTSETRRMVLLK